MDKLRSKKRGFFAISTVLSSSSDKKRNKGSRLDNDVEKEKAEFKYFKDNQCASINANGEYQDFDGVTDDDLEHGDTSDHSSSEVETAVSGSSCDDVHKASRKLQTFAKKSIRRDKKKEKEKQERKEKNKLSMDDFLSKQVEFITWLEEEKHKNPKEMSSPKRKAYFKSFLKLWNKRKLPQKYYRGSAEIQSPCPTHPTRTFSFADDEEEVVSFTRPKPKRLSIEPWGPPDSPFSTFGKTPPKHLLTSNIPLLESFSPVTDSSLSEETHNTSGSYRQDSFPKLGEYQMPKNALPMVASGQSTPSTDNRNLDNNATSLPGTPASSFPDNSPVYAVPWKPKPTPRKKPPVITESVTSPPPPPVPPKSFLTDHDDDNVTKQPAHHGQHASEMCTIEKASGVSTNYEQRSNIERVSVTESCSSMEVDDCAQEMGESRKEGWHSPVAGKPFSPPVKIRKTFFSQEQIYAEIDSLEMRPSGSSGSESSDINHAHDITSAKNNEDDVFTEPVSDSQTSHKIFQSESSSIVTSPESQVKHVVLENLQKAKESRFSFSKYLITPEKRAVATTKHSSLSENGKENVSSRKRLGQQHEKSISNNENSRKEKPKVLPRNIPKLRSEYRVTMTVSNGLHNVRNFVVGDNKLPRTEDPVVKKNDFEKAKSPGQLKKEHHSATAESKLEMSEKFSMSLDELGSPKPQSKEKVLETDIDSVPLPIMGSKTPPRKRKPLSNLQRSKSMETIIW